MADAHSQCCTGRCSLRVTSGGPVGLLWKCLTLYDEAARRFFNHLFDLVDPGIGNDVPVFRHLVRQECPGLI